MWVPACLRIRQNKKNLCGDEYTAFFIILHRRLLSGVEEMKIKKFLVVLKLCHIVSTQIKLLDNELIKI